MADDRFEVGQLVEHAVKSASRRRPGVEYGMVIGVRDNAVDTVHVLPRRQGTRFWDETDNPSDPARDNVLLHDCDDVPMPGTALRVTAYNGDCYAISSRTETWRKDECDIQDGGVTFLKDDVATVLDHVHRSVRQKDLLQEEQDAARKAPVRRCVPGDRHHSDAVQEPGEGEVAVDPFGQRRQRRSMAAQLEEADRRQARLRAGPEQAPRAEPSPDGRTVEERLDTLSRTGVRPPDTGHGGLGS